MMGQAVPPAGGSSTEAEVIRVWAELLGVVPEGPHADFFALGGESLALIQFMARVQETFGVELPIEALFTDELTVATAAKAIDAGLLAAVGDDELAALLDQVDALSEEEIRVLLAGDV
jgi:acyl carrier protein